MQVRWLRGLSVSQDKIGNVLLGQGNLSDALESYRQAMAVSERLALSDPSNTGWQRDLSVSFNKIGDVLSGQGNLGDALEYYRQSMAVRKRLALSDPSNAAWQRDLVVSHFNLASIARDAGEPNEEQAQWNRCYAVLVGMQEAGMYLDEKLQILMYQLEAMNP